MKPSRLILTAILVVALGSGLAVLWLRLQSGRGAVGQDLERVADEADHDASSRLSRRRQGQDLTSALSNAAPGGHSHPSPRGQVVVRVESSEGNPIVGLQVGWRAEETISRRKAGTSTTDSFGEFRAEVEGAGRLKVNSLDDRWLLEPEYPIPVDGSTLVVKAVPCVSISIVVICEGGESYSGRGRIAESAQLGANARFQAWFSVEAEKPVLITGVPQSRDMVVILDEAVMGYAEHKHTIACQDVVEGKRIVIAVPRTKSAKGQIEVDLSSFVGTVKSIEARSEGTMQVAAVGYGEDVDASRRWLSKPLAAGTFTLRVLGDATWETAGVVVRAGEVTKVRVAMEPLCEVRIRVVDEQGEPIPSAVLSRNVEGYFDFDRSLPEAGITAISDAGGHAKLAPLCSSRHTLLIEARGYEPRLIEVDLASGEVCDAGSVALKKALGRVVLNLVGTRKGQTYFITLLKPGGTAFRRIRSAETTHEFDALPFRRYVVAVALGKGGRVVSCDVVPSETDPEITVELDVSTIGSPK